MIDLQLARARAEFFNADGDFLKYRNYIRAHNLDAEMFFRHIGGAAVIQIIDCGNGRFEFAKSDGGFSAFVCEALDKDGETCIDLVAWSLSDPSQIFSMFGKCGLLGASQATSPSTYIFGQPLTIHKTALDWLKSDCDGACVVTQHVAARMFLDLPGQLAARDYQHSRLLKALVESVVRKDRVVIPQINRRAAA